jgi:fused signal recognition particle receptor
MTPDKDTEIPRSETSPDDAAPVGPPPEATAPDLMHTMASQQRAFERLVDAITAEREREREEFRATVASLAAEIREREAIAERLARQTRVLTKTLADQKAALAQEEQRADDTAVHARNLEAMLAAAERASSEAVTAHAAEVERLREQLAEAARLRDEARQATRLAEQRVETASAERAEMERIHEEFRQSRAGRILHAYVRLKRRLLGTS